MFRKIFFWGIVFVLTSCSTDSSTKIPEQVLEYAYSNEETDLLNIVNSYRENKGLNRLTVLNHASYLCAEHNKYMIRTKSVNHDSFVSRSDELITLFKATNVSENIGYDYLSNQAVFAAWLGSSNHKKNIEGSFTHFGLSIRRDPVSGKSYYTNIFVSIPQAK
jgi:uncharacterized protein YkwD